MSSEMTMTDQDWRDFERSARGEPTPKLKTDPSPGHVEDPTPGPEQASPEIPVRIKSADEIVAEYACTTSEIPADSGEHRHPKFEPPPVPARRGATRAPQAPQHLSTARTEVVALRQEVAALRQEQSETARLVREIHARVVTEDA